jgi:hypothetical protein
MTKTTKTTKTTTKTTSAPVSDNQALILNAIKRRIEVAPNDNQKEKLTTEHTFFEGVNAQVMLDKVSHLIDLATLARRIAYTEKENKTEFVAVYALQKIRKMIYALANNASGFVDGYTRPILANLATLQTLTAKSRLVTLSKSIEYTELDKVQAIKRSISVAVNTAGTQASSSKQLFILLNITTGVKGKKDDEIEYRDNDIANTVKTWFAV